MRLGIDVGGTNTDAALLERGRVLGWAKRPTTHDVESGIVDAIGAVLADAGVKPSAITCVMIGTTQFVNAFVERRNLVNVGVIRLGSPVGDLVPPLSGWPQDLRACIGDHVYRLPGGYEYDGREIKALDPAAVRAAARAMRTQGLRAVAISSVFAPVNAAMERAAAAIVAEELPEARIVQSATIGRMGLLERENATIMSAALVGIAGSVVASFGAALRRLAIAAPFYVTQNDGTLITAERASATPVLTFGSGPTNSMRGAAFLTGRADAIVIDVGGTTTDIGVLAKGFPRESSVAVDIGGIPTNFRMPDILSLGLGGGSRVRIKDNDLTSITVGPDSVGYRLTQEAYLFGGSTLTASDIAAAAGLADFGDRGRLPPLPAPVVAAVLARVRTIIEDGIDRIKTARGDVPAIVVGGGAMLVPDGLKGISELVRPNHASVANAVGAAIAQVSGEVEQLVTYDTAPRDDVLADLRRQAEGRVVSAGGDPATVEVVEVDEVMLSYMPGHAAQVRVKAVGDLAL